MAWLEKSDVLITASKDKRIKVLFIVILVNVKYWKLPLEWRDSKLEAEEEKEATIKMETHKI